MYDAFVLAAGLGTRLRPLTDHRPKPLVPVAGVPMLAYALALCARHGLRDVVVNAHWLPDQLRDWEGEREGVIVTVSEELPSILGTGGGLKKVAAELAPRFAVVNADVLADVDLGALLEAVPAGGAAMALRPSDAERYGIVAADETGAVVRLVDVARAPSVGAVVGDTHFTGIHALDRSTLDLIPDGFACVVRTAYKALVPRRLVRGLRHQGLWLDVGDPAAYLDANLAALAGLPLPIDPGERAAWSRIGGVERGARGAFGRAEISGDAWIGAGVHFGGGVRLRDSVVGDGARVSSDAVLDRCVAWDGALVPPGEHVRTVFFPGGALTA